MENEVHIVNYNAFFEDVIEHLSQSIIWIFDCCNCESNKDGI